MKNRRMIGTEALDVASQLMKDRIPIATIVKLLKIDREMHYRTAFDIIKADVAGKHNITRPNWLKPMPNVQEAPSEWKLVDGTSWTLIQGRN